MPEHIQNGIYFGKKVCTKVGFGSYMDSDSSCYMTGWSTTCFCTQPTVPKNIFNCKSLYIVKDCNIP
jgi:hypothetical protein